MSPWGSTGEICGGGHGMPCPHRRASSLRLTAYGLRLTAKSLLQPDDHAIEITRVIRQPLATVGSNDHGVTVTKPGQSRYVQPRLHAQDHVLRDNGRIALVDKWCFVPLEADPVSSVVSLQRTETH